MPGMFDATKPLPIPEIGKNIINVQSDKVPFLRLIKKGSMPNQMLASWPVELYPDRGFVGTLDGVDHSTYTHFSREKLEAYAMLLRTEGVLVTKIAQLTTDAGVDRKKEIAKQILQDGKILAQMMERSLLSNLDMAVESGATPYRSRGLLSWLSTTAQGVKPVHASFRPAAAAVTATALASWTDIAVEAQLEAMAIQKKAPVDLKCFTGLKGKRAMSLWGQKVTADADLVAVTTNYNIDAKEKRLLQIIDKFEFDSGVFYSLLSFYLHCDESTGAASASSSRSAAFVDTSMWEISYLQEPMAFSNPDLGAGPRAYHDVVFMLKCLNPMGQGCNITAT